MNNTGAETEPTTPSDTPTEPIADRLPDIIDWLPESLKPGWQLLDQMPILAGLAIVVFFFVAAVLIRSLLIRFLQRLTSETETPVDNILVDCLRKPLFTTIMYFGVALGITASQLPFASEALVNLCISVIIASWMRSTFLASTRILKTLGDVHDRFPVVEPRTVPLLDLSIKLVILLLGSYALLVVWGINPIGWLASAGIVGIAVGFAAKDTLSNVFSGFFILIDAPYKVGDYVNLDTGERGCVTHIGLRSTRLLSREDIEITLPNAVIANAKIVNESGGNKPHIRIAVAVGAAYGSDVDQVCDILQQIGEQHPEIAADPAPRVRMRKFGASSLDFELLGWILKPEDRGRIKHELLMSIYKQFRAQGIEIPYAKSDLYIKELPPIGGTSSPGE
jgi:small-conductance mechanosensitive channel